MNSTATTAAEVASLGQSRTQPGAIGRWISSARFGLRLAAFVIVTLVFWAMMEVDFIIRRKTRRIDVINTWTPRWSGTLLRVFGIRVAARGPYASEGKVYPGRDDRAIGRIFVMNHRSGADIPIILSLAAVHVISRHDVANWPLIGAGGKRIGTLFVDRTSRRSGATVLQQVADVLGAGEGVAMFPEGTAHVGDEVHDFKPGAFKAALRADCEIVPMGIAYGDPTGYYAGQPFMKHMKRIAKLQRLPVAVEIGEPIRVTGRDAIELKDEVRQRVEELVHAARSRMPHE
jgi:1-acyl-sn-glycerol-3-phosphate acyltransferase